MNYLDMILAEAATPLARKDRKAESSASADARAKKAAKSAARGSSSEISISYKKTTAVQKKREEISKLERMIASGKDEYGRELNPDRIRALKAQLAAEKKAYADLVKASSGKRKSTAFSYSSKKDSGSISNRRSGSGSASSSQSGSDTAEKIYLEGYFTALEELGYFDEDDDYDDYDYNDYDDDDATEAYLEGYYMAYLDNGYDID